MYIVEKERKNKKMAVPQTTSIQLKNIYPTRDNSMRRPMKNLQIMNSFQNDVVHISIRNQNDIA